MDDDFARTHARAGDPETSHEAAAKAPSLARQHQRVILDHLFSIAPRDANMEEIGDATGIEKHAIGRRLSELFRDGLIMPVSRRTMRTGRDGRTWQASRSVGQGDLFANPRPGTRRTNGERHLVRMLLMAAASCQGGHSEVGGLIADYFKVPFPLSMQSLERAATSEGFEPRDLWPWLYKMRAGGV